jgi:hypothetical protein
MKVQTIALTTALVALAAPAVARAQDGGSTPIGGHVSSYLELIITQPAKGFDAFATAKSYATSIDAQTTATDKTTLSIADGDAISGSKRGHLSVGAKRLPAPLEVTVGGAAFQPLDGPLEPLLAKRSDAGSRIKSTIKLRQKVTGKATGTYRKLVLVTLSTETP